MVFSLPPTYESDDNLVEVSILDLAMGAHMRGQLSLDILAGFKSPTQTSTSSTLEDTTELNGDGLLCVTALPLDSTLKNFDSLPSTTSPPSGLFNTPSSMNKRQRRAKDSETYVLLVSCTLLV